jgi:hypothetical protein
MGVGIGSLSRRMPITGFAPAANWVDVSRESFTCLVNHPCAVQSREILAVKLVKFHEFGHVPPF